MSRKSKAKDQTKALNIPFTLTQADLVQKALAVAKEQIQALNILVKVPGQGLFQSRDWRHFRSKDPTRADMAQFPVAHAQNILPNRARDWRHYRSRD